MYPFTLNAAFTCELYMKTILIHNSADGTIARGHKLDELFNALPKDAQNLIETLFNKKLKHDLHLFLAKISHFQVQEMLKLGFMQELI